MITQADTLRAEITTLEAQLQHAALHQDAFSQIEIYKKLEIAKSILINIY
tara:strand:- start:45 stop:194 length:150 start_codon:yes stop_codon:yes gene_type:complete